MFLKRPDFFYCLNARIQCFYRIMNEGYFQPEGVTVLPEPNRKRI